jgi:hypothetical protein
MGVGPKIKGLFLPASEPTLSQFEKRSQAKLELPLMSSYVNGFRARPPPALGRPNASAGQKEGPAHRKAYRPRVSRTTSRYRTAIARAFYEVVTMKMKTMMIATAARQRPMNRSSRAVKSRSAMVPLPSDLCRNDTTDGRGKNLTPRE